MTTAARRRLEEERRRISQDQTLPAWDVPLPNESLPRAEAYRDYEQRKAQNLEAFKARIFLEIDRRIFAQINAMADEIQQPENIDMFVETLQRGWKPPPEPKRGRGQPAKDQFYPPEAAARLTVMIREIFWDLWKQKYRSHPSADELAAEYIGTKLALVAARKKRDKARRRPE